MVTWNKVYLSSNRGVYFSIFLLLVIIFSTIWFYYQNTNILEENTKYLKEKIIEQEKDLENLKKNNNLKVFSLLKSNMSNFRIKEKYSNIPVLINKIEDLWKEYDINFKTFSYSNWKINLKAESRQRSIDDNPSEKIVKFIWDFRTKIEYDNSFENSDKKAKEKIIEPKIKDFNLDFIKTFSWESKIDFNMILKINIKEYLKEEDKKEEIKEKSLSWILSPWQEKQATNAEKEKKEIEFERIEEEEIEKQEQGKTTLSIAEKIKAQNEKNKKEKVDK